MPHRRISRTEVIENVSGLVRELAATYWAIVVTRSAPRALVDLCETAHHLVADHADYETPARRAGWLPDPGDTLGRVYLDTTRRDGEDESFYHAASWQEACARSRVSPALRPIESWWTVTGWLADRLEERGERVGHIAGLVVWACTATADDVLKDIWRSITDLPDHEHNGDHPP